MMGKEIHLICNAHIDPIWLWDWEEGAAAAVATFRAAADLANEYDYIFCHNEALLYEWIEEYEPKLFGRIKDLVKEGKWHIMGGWYLQPDCNLPCGESLVRQAMEGRIYFTQKFGKQNLPKTAVNLDSFGHSLGLPQILKKCGFENYLFMRPTPNDEQGIPAHPFIWQGLDGSKVKAAFSGSYNTPLGKVNEKVESYYNQIEAAPDVQILCWGVGNHGGGPSKKDLEYLSSQIENKKDIKLIHSTPDNFFSRLVPQTIFNKSINICNPGCYTSLMTIKQTHRKLENNLYSVEKMLSAAALNGLMEYPEIELKEAQKDLLFCEFHDILAGTCIKKGEKSALRRLMHGLGILDKLRLRAFFALSSCLPKAKEGEYPILVYNAHPYTVKTVIDCEFMLADQNWNEDIWTGADVFYGDKKLPSQLSRESSTINLDWAKRVIFECDLKPFTMHMFSARPVKTSKPVIKDLSRDGDYVYEDACKRIVLDTKSGFIKDIRIYGKSFVKRGAFTPVVYTDNADPWAMGAAQRERLGKREKAFRLMSPKETAAFLASSLREIAPIRIVEDGDVCQIIEGIYKYNRSTVVIWYKIYKNFAYIDVDIKVTWCENDKMLKLHIPAAIKGDYIGQIAYGSEIFPQNGRECASQQWISYGNSKHALAIINDSVYGSSCENGDIGITLLRGAVYAAHPINDRPIIPQNRLSDRIDQGEHFFRFRILGGNTEEVLPSLDRMAQLFNEKPYSINMFPSGAGSTPGSVIRLSDGSVTLTAFKKAHGDNGFIMRLFNNKDKNCNTVLTVKTLSNEVSLPLSFCRYEFKTICYKKGELVETELAEI